MITLAFMTPNRRTAVAGFALVQLAFAGCQAHPSTPKQPSGVPLRVVASAAPSESSAPATKPPEPRQPRPRKWRLRDDSPFQLVAEGLHNAVATRLEDTLIISAAPCSSRDDQAGAHPQSFSRSLYAAQGDHFSALPDSPPFSGRRVSGWGISGHWPSDIWLTYGFGRESDGATEQFHQWDGQRWHTIETAPFNVSGLEPHRIFDWFDGTKLVAQAGHWYESVSYRVRVEPFRVWGKTSHRPPDFSSVQFPRYRAAENVHVYYDVSPSHEVFVTHVLTKEKPDGTVVTVARANTAGEIHAETVLDTPGFADGHVALGRWGERDVAIAWGETLLSLSSELERPWLKLFDGTSWKPFPIPGPPASRDSLSKLWIADERIWARRGDVIWRFANDKWVKHARVHQSAPLSDVLPGGTMWSTYVATLTRIDEHGASHTVPLVDDPPRDFGLVGVVAMGVDDIWVRAYDGDEILFFRTKPMQLLACD